MTKYNLSEHELLFEGPFWNQFEIDLQLVQARLVIQSAFIANRRVRQLITLVTPLIKRNVQICVHLQKPDTWNIPSSRLSREAAAKREATTEDIKALQDIGVHVILREQVHTKFAILDEAVFYEGSLNILSHNSSFEGMRRFNSVSQTRKRIRQERFMHCPYCKKLREDRKFDSVQEQLRSARKDLQLTQQEVSKLTNIKQSQIAKFEGGIDLRISTLSKIAESLGMKVVLIPNSLTPLLANVLNQIESHKLLSAFDERNLAPQLNNNENDAYTDFSPNMQMRVNESEFHDTAEYLQDDRLLGHCEPDLFKEHHAPKASPPVDNPTILSNDP